MTDSDAQSLLRLVHPADGLYSILGLPPRRNYIDWVKDAEEAEVAASLLDERDFRGVFFGLGEVAAIPPPTDKGASRGTEDHVIRCWVAWADLDPINDREREHPEEIVQRLRHAVYEDKRVPHPSAIVRTGGGLHAYWRLSSPAEGEDLAHLLSIVSRTRDRLSGDRAVVDLARILRVPGTRNRKPEYNPPKPVELLFIRDDPKHFFTLQILAAALDLPWPPPPHRLTPDEAMIDAATQRPLNMEEALTKKIPPNEGHPTLLSIAGRLRRDGLQKEAATEMVAYAGQNCSPSWPREEVVKLVDDVFSRYPAESKADTPLVPPASAPLLTVALVALANETLTPDADQRGQGFTHRHRALGLYLARASCNGRMSPSEDREARELIQEYRGRLLALGIDADEALSHNVLSSISQIDLVALDLEEPEVLWGDPGYPLISTGEAQLLHAREGVGKSYLLFGLAQAIASGASEFLGVPCLGEPRPVLVATPEPPRKRLQERVLSIMGQHEPLEHLHYIGDEDLMGFDLAGGGSLLALIRRAKEIEAVLVMLDPIRNLWMGAETNEEFAALGANLTRIRIEVSCALLLSHHEGKGDQTGRSKRTDEDAFRGATALRAAMHSVIRLSEPARPYPGAEEGSRIVRLSHTKSNFGPRAEDVYLDLGTPWSPVTVPAPPSPSEQKVMRVASVLDVLRRSGDWMARSAVEGGAGLNVSSDTVKKYLQDLIESGKVEETGERRWTRYRAIKEEPSGDLEYPIDEEEECPFRVP